MQSRVNTTHYFASTYNGNNFVGVNAPNGKKFPEYPCIQVTVNTNVGNFYVVNAEKISDTQFNVIFNRNYDGSFILAASYNVVDT